jgi:rRNA maturation endonuclease Nob1
MQEEDAIDFFKRVTEGTKQHREIDLTHESGSTLTGVKMHPVDKVTLSSIFEKLPEDLFDEVEDAETAAEAEEQLQESEASVDAVNPDTVEAFETLCKESLDHPDLTAPQMETIVDELAFEVLFEVGSEVIELSSEQTGAVQDFQKRA